MNIRQTGWSPDAPDTNDYSLKTDQINALVRQIQILRGFDDFLESLQAKPDSFNNPLLILLWDSIEKIQIKVKGSKRPLREAITHLRDDIKIISRSLSSGIDLIAVSRSPGSTDYRPLIPPISPRVLKIFDSSNIIHPTDGSDKKKLYVYYDYNNPELMKARQILHEIAPIAKHGRGEALKDAIEKEKEKLSQSSSPKDYRPENIIKIDPETMYNLLSKEELPGDGTAENSPSNNRGGAISTGEIPPIRIPLNGALSNQLRGKSAQNYILPDIVDLSYWCSPVKFQKEFSSCTSHAVASLVEYFQNRLADRHPSDFTPAVLSARFLYKVTRHLGEQEEAHRKRGVA